MENAMVLLLGVTDINYRKTKVVFAAKKVSGVKAIPGNNQVDDYRFWAVEKVIESPAITSIINNHIIAKPEVKQPINHHESINKKI